MKVKAREVRRSGCGVRELSRLCPVWPGVVWTMKFSKNGKYLATAGQDTLVRVWEVVLQRDERGQPAATPSSPPAPCDAPAGDGPAGVHANGGGAAAAAGGGGGAGTVGDAAGGGPAHGGVGEGRDGCEGGAAAPEGVHS